MKIGIHKQGNFSTKWIEYCESNNINYKIVDCYKNDIIQELNDCDALMWHHSHVSYKDVLTAKRILFALEHGGKVVYPNFYSGWHFDDKVAQKYLLEEINAPLIPSYVFYDRETALSWAKMTVYPTVFKLKGGAGATNVRLIRSYKECQSVIKKAFSSGFAQHNPYHGLKDVFNKYISGTATIRNVFGGILRIIRPREFDRIAPKEKGYVYFQKFISGNDNDIRLIVIGGKYAYGMKRKNRKGDFRASGSSEYIYDNIPIEAVKIAFSVANQLCLQSVAFDFVHDENQRPVIIEMSYGFGTAGSSKSPGYWTSDLEWHEGKFNSHGWMVEEILTMIKTEHYKQDCS